MEEVQRVISAATGTMRPMLLLMCNCGMTQKDISDLRNDEIDWQAGRIIRKRSKTANRESTPTVNYPLWPGTLAALKEHRAQGERALLTKTGKPLVRSEMRDGKLTMTDVVAGNYKLLQARLDFRKPMKQLRKTSASLLATHAVYGRFVDLFLGHSAKSMADRHYAAPPQQLFDEAVTWLGEQLGIAE